MQRISLHYQQQGNAESTSTKRQKYAPRLASMLSHQSLQGKRKYRQVFQARLREETERGEKERKYRSRSCWYPTWYTWSSNDPSWLDNKSSPFFRALEAEAGGVVNSCVVKATALALVNSNKSTDLRGFESTAPWVKSIYRRCNFTLRAGTTTRPPVPRGRLYLKWWTGNRRIGERGTGNGERGTGKEESLLNRESLKWGISNTDRESLK